MKEELHILIGTKWKEVDLSTPSGISLKYQNVIFGDLSKINASFSYTFKLPMTARNRRVFESVEDTRVQSSVSHTTFQCRYIQNGISVFNNASIYISSIDTNYNCYMTWGDAEGLRKLKEDGLSLRDLGEFDDIAVWGGSYWNPSFDVQFDNSQKFINAYYNAGVVGHDFNRDNRRPSIYIGDYLDPVTVSVYSILKIIESRYKIKFPWLQAINGDIPTEDIPYRHANLGLLPVVKNGLSDIQISQCYIRLGDPFVYNRDTSYDSSSYEYRPYTIKFRKATKYGIEYGWGNNLCDRLIYATTRAEYPDYNYDHIVSLTVREQAEGKLSGLIYGNFEGVGNGVIPKMYLCKFSHAEANSEGFHKLEREDFASIDGCYNYEQSRWEFDMRGDLGLVIDWSEDFELWFSHKPTSLGASSSLVLSATNVNKKFISCSNPRIGMPDIKLIDFVKAIIQMEGHFPMAREKNIETYPYDIYLQRLNNEGGPIYVDWSNKINRTMPALCSKSERLVKDFARNNIFMMSTDSEDGTSNNGDDVYEDGRGIFGLTSSLITEFKKSIVKLPFAPPYVKNRKWPRFPTGGTIKSFEITQEKNKYGTLETRAQYCEPKPAIGIIGLRNDITIKFDGSIYEGSDNYRTLTIWNGFADLMRTSSMRYLKAMLDKPVVVTENLNLNEFDLRDLDMTVPVYLSQHNAYFAIISIQRDNKGVSKCEFIKLPTKLY